MYASQQPWELELREFISVTVGRVDSLVGPTYIVQNCFVVERKAQVEQEISREVDELRAQVCPILSR